MLLRVKHRVVVDRHIRRSARDRHEMCPRSPGGAADVVEHVVEDGDAARELAARARRVVGSEDVDRPVHVPHDVGADRDILHNGPGCGVVLVSRRQHERVAALARLPVVLDDVALDPDALGVLQLDRVLHVPQRAAGTRRTRRLPGARVGEGGARAARVAIDPFTAGARAPVDAIPGSAAHRAPADRDRRPDDTPIDTSADGAEYARLPPEWSSATTLK